MTKEKVIDILNGIKDGTAWLMPNIAEDGDPLMLTCENCGYAVMRYNNTPFCPNCGAKMEVE